MLNGRYQKEKIDKDLQSMGYKNLEDFYAKHPESNFDATPITTKIVRGVGRMAVRAKDKVKSMYKRYMKK